MSDILGSNNLFAEFLDDYFAECEEHLAVVRQELLALEPLTNRPAEPSILDRLFRCFHSLKGLSGMVGVKEAEDLAHHQESYLRALREQQVVLSPEGFDALMVGAKLLEEVIAAYRSQDNIPNIERAIAQLANVLPKANPASPQGTITPVELKLPEPAIQQLVEAQKQGLQAWHFVFIPKNELTERGINVNQIRECLQKLGQLIHAAPRLQPDGEIAFDFIITTNQNPETIITGGQKDGLSWKPYSSAGKSQEAKSKREETQEETISQRTSIDAGGQTPGEEPSPKLPGQQPPGTVEPHSQPAPPTLPLAQSSNVVRVELPKLDSLMHKVGELVISRARLEENLRYLSDKLPASELRTMQEINQILERQMRDLRESVMRVRLVPIGEVFARMQFVVRDLVRASEKEVKLEVSGQETEIDKLVVERMIDPLLHLVRNAVSHGIETPTERQQAGKPTGGKIALRASTVGETVVVEIEDDGRGVNCQKVVEKAVERGLLQEKDKASSEDSTTILELLCSSGFSTREEADLTSGRGVGMAIVKNTVLELGGLLTLNTKPGVGTCFTIQLPLTLAIADALIVKVRDQIFAIPQSSVVEVMDLEPDKITVLENNEIIFYRGHVLPILRLERLFRYKNKKIFEGAKNEEIVRSNRFSDSESKVRSNRFSDSESKVRSNRFSDSKSKEEIVRSNRFSDSESKTDETGGTPVLKNQRRNTLSVAIVGNNLNGLNACGIVVDKFVGLREIVARPLTDPLVRVPGITGATELGDGRVVLILDIGRLLAEVGKRQYEAKGNTRQEAKGNTRQEAKGKRQE